MSDQNNFNAVGWFEIPVIDMNRAIQFYEAVFGYKLDRHQMGELDMAWFPSHDEAKGASGSLVKHQQFYTPSTTGILIYFTCPSGKVQTEFEKATAAGAKVVVPPRQISPEYGYMAVVTDTEGNNIALHSREG
ncbi:VOC family protein [Candidatus Peregrinibacteria bacterium]|nr:VOC family protein [Candidatus Peregrinibacteria bacterium]